MSSTVTNILLKITAVLLAVLLWFHVVSKKQYEYNLTLPVKQIDLPAGIAPVGGFPDSLVVRVLASGKQLLRTDWKDSGLRIKGARLRRGINTLDLNLESVSLVRAENVTLLDLPGAGAITIQIEKMDSVVVPIVPRVSVEPAHGLMILPEQTRLTPARTKVIGPVSLINHIDSVFTEPLVIDQADSTVQYHLKLQFPEGMGIRLQHDSVLATIGVEKSAMRRFEPVPVTMGRNALGGETIFEPDRVAVDLECPEQIIDTLSGSIIRAFVNNDGAMRDGYLKVEVVYPNHCTLIRVVPESVRVTVRP